MSERTPTIGSWPRLELEVAIREAAELAYESVAEAAHRVSLDTTGLRFHPTAPRRVSLDDLNAFRQGVVEVATRHGFPDRRMRGGQPTFDQELASRMPVLAPMLPAEAFDQEIWAFIGLRVLPDISVWRLVNNAEGEYATIPDAALKRLFDRRRGIYRRAWWRGTVLGPESVLQLDEDNMMNLLERPGLVGNPTLARVLIETHLAFKHDPAYDARHDLRAALIRVGVLMGRLTLDALDAELLRAMVHSAFASTIDAPHDSAAAVQSPHAQASGTTVVQDVDRAPHERAGRGEAYVSGAPALEPEGASARAAGDGAPQVAATQSVDPLPRSFPVDEEVFGSTVGRFLELAAPYRELLLPELRSVSLLEAISLSRRVTQYARSLGGDPTAQAIALDLDLLVDDWPSLDADDRAVVHAAMAYFVMEGDARSDREAGGLIDDDEVVNAAFAALGRTRTDS